MHHLRTAILIVAVAAVAVLLLWQLPRWQTADAVAFLDARELLDLQNQIRQTLAILLGAGAILTGMALLWRRVAAGERVALDAVRLAEETQRSERFTRAVGQLGDERLEVRLGAIYALEQVAHESRQHHQPAMEVLCAYLRERAAWDGERPPAPRLATDVQAVLTVLGRRTTAHETATPFRLDLRRTDLRGADLREAHLDGTYMVEARLEGADLGGAHMAGAYLGGASLQGADLGGAHLDGAYMYKANLEGASLHAARVVSTIGVHRDERERVNRTAAEAEESPPRSTEGHRGDLPTAKPTLLRQVRR